jgi:hypothetical protein
MSAVSENDLQAAPMSAVSENDLHRAPMKESSTITHWSGCR